MIAQIADQIPMDEALAEMKRLLPSLESLNIASIYKEVSALNIQMEWTNLPFWESMSDLEIFRAIFPARLNTGSLIAIPDACFWVTTFTKKVDPLGVESRNMETLLSNFLNEIGISFFDGDTLFFSPANRWIFLFDHDGNYATVDLDKSLTSSLPDNS